MKNEDMMTLEHALVAETDRMAAALARAHESGQRVPHPAISAPASAKSAMRIQALVQELLARPVGGWKVAIGPEKRPVAAPLLDMQDGPADIILLPNFTIEVELAVRLGKDLPKRETGSYQRSDIVGAIESVVLGIEVIGGRFDDAANVPFLSFLADNLGNRAYVVGDRLPLSAIDQVGDMACHVTLDGLSLHHAPASHPAGDPLLPLLAYANEQSDCLGGLRAGQIVTTGTLCGVLPVKAPGLLEARLGEIGQVSIRFAD
jgi:2-keto-4-pentenoate hydratase